MTSPAWLHQLDGAVRVELYVAPRAAQTRIVGEHDGRLKLQVAAPPVDGAANQAVCRAIAGWLGVAKSAVVIASGSTGRRKAVRVSGVDLDHARRQLTQVAR